MLCAMVQIKTKTIPMKNIRIFRDPILKAMIQSEKRWKSIPAVISTVLGSRIRIWMFLKPSNQWAESSLQSVPMPDAPQHVAFAFDKLEKVLLDLGFKYYAVYKEGKPHMLKLG